MKYRGVEYYVAQGVEAGTWKFSTSMNDKIRTVRGKSRQDAAIYVQQYEAELQLVVEEERGPRSRF
jgi:hypothetical protein